MCKIEIILKKEYVTNTIDALKAQIHTGSSFCCDDSIWL